MRRKKLVPGRLYELSWEDYVFYKDHNGWQWHWNRALTLGGLSPSAKLFFVEVVEIEHEGVRWRLAKCLYNEQYYHFGSWDYGRDRFDLPELIPVEKCHDD